MASYRVVSWVVDENYPAPKKILQKLFHVSSSRIAQVPVPELRIFCLFFSRPVSFFVSFLP